jgi:hypothetical protein
MAKLQAASWLRALALLTTLGTILFNALQVIFL